MHQSALHVVSVTPTRPAWPHTTSTQPDVLGRILDPGVNLCVRQRPTQRTVALELLRLRSPELAAPRCTTSSASFDDVCALLRQQDLGPPTFENRRIGLGPLTALLFGISKGRDVMLRLGSTENDGCPRFHAGRTHLTLLRSYREPETEWLTDAQVDRGLLHRSPPIAGTGQTRVPFCLDC